MLKKIKILSALIALSVLFFSCSAPKTQIPLKVNIDEIDSVMVDHDSIYPPPRAVYYFAEGYLKEIQESFEQAFKNYQLASRMDSLSPVVLYSLYEMSLKTENNKAIIVYGNKLYRKFGNIYILDNVAEAYQNEGDPYSAIEVYKVLTNFFPEETEYHYQLASLYITTDELDKALSLLNKIGNPRYKGRVLNKYGRIALLNGDLENAKEYFTRSIEYDTWESNSYLGLATCYEILGILDSAAFNYNRYLEFSPDNQTIWNNLIELYFAMDQYSNLALILERYLEYFDFNPLKYRQLGIAYYYSNQKDKAAQVFSDLLKEGFEDYDVYMYLGKSSRNLDRYAFAESCFLNALEKTISPPPMIDLAVLYSLMDSLHKAVEIIEYAKGLYPDAYEIYYYMGTIYSRFYEYTNAIIQFLNALALNPDDDYSLFALGDAYERSGQRLKAISIFEEMITRNPENPITLNYLGYILAEEGIRLEYSRELIEKALNLDPQSGAIIDSYGWVLYKLGSVEQALIQLYKALEYIDTDPTIYDHLAQVLFELGQIEEAREMWEKALKFEMDSNLEKSINNNLDKVKP
ncbi:tetratricopeptide repeat protein [bacterium]|nr:tetratricopeptide repeat protein [bacterium]